MVKDYIKPEEGQEDDAVVEAKIAAAKEAAIIQQNLDARTMAKRSEVREAGAKRGPRRDRLSELRNLTTKYDVRLRLDNFYKISSALDISFLTPPPGYTLGWMVRQIHDAPFEGQIRTALRMGWQYVTGDEYPEMVVEGESMNEHNRIYCKGCVLMKIPTELFDAYQEYNNYRTTQQMEATRRLNDTLQDNGGALRPLRNNSHTTSFGRGNYLDDPNY